MKVTLEWKLWMLWVFSTFLFLLFCFLTYFEGTTFGKVHYPTLLGLSGLMIISAGHGIIQIETYNKKVKKKGDEL